MKLKLEILLAIVILIFNSGCNSQSVSTKPAVSTNYKLTDSERMMCDTLQIDTTIIQDIRLHNSNKIEPFHYSLSKIIEKDTEIEAEPIFLKGLVLSEQNSKSYDFVFALKDIFKMKGYSIFLLENNFGFDKKPDNIGVLKTIDKYAVLKQVKTDGLIMTLLMIVYFLSLKYLTKNMH